jgi:dihydrofolate synthase/folylpolyglutamate synthase
MPEAAIRGGLAATQWPGRYEAIDAPAGSRFVLDGAHTPASAAALAATLRAEERRAPDVLVLGLLRDKEPAAFLRALAPLIDRIVVTQSRSPRAIGARELAEHASANGSVVEVATNVDTAVTRAAELAGAGGLVIVTGSLSVVAEAREALGLAVADPLPPA